MYYTESFFLGFLFARTKSRNVESDLIKSKVVKRENLDYIFLCVCMKNQLDVYEECIYRWYGLEEALYIFIYIFLFIQ